MCYECGCWGSVTPYGVGGREMNQAPKDAVGGIPPKFNRTIAGEPEVEIEEDYEIGEDD